MDYEQLKKYTRNINLLYIEDDMNFRKEFSEVLQDIFPILTISVDGEDALNKYKSFFSKNGCPYDLVISDIKMPKINGIEFINTIYNINPEQKIIVLSAVNEANYLKPLINLGIEKFISKPIQYSTFLEDILNISAVINDSKYSKDIIVFNKHFFWSTEKKELIHNKKTVKLTKKEVLLIDIFLRNKGSIITRDEIINFIWPSNICTDYYLNNLKSLIYNIRKKVPPLQIKSIYGLGYKVYIKTI
mgnify:CR=1 FL=1